MNNPGKANRPAAIVATCVLLFAPAVFALDIQILTQGATASADFASVDSTGCVTTSVHVETGNDFVYRNPPTAPVPVRGTPTVFIVLSRDDACTGDSSVVFGGNVDGPVDLAWDHRLDQVSVRGMATLFVVGDGGMVLSSFDVSVDLAWTGAGDPFRVHGDVEYKSGAFMVNVLNNLEVRIANASGTISDGTTNFTPLAATFAFDSWGGFHQVLIQCAAPICG